MASLNFIPLTVFDVYHQDVAPLFHAVAFYESWHIAASEWSWYVNLSEN